MIARYGNDGEPAFPFAAPRPQSIPQGALRALGRWFMEPHAENRRKGLALVRRDLLADWRGWSAAERLTALATGFVLGLAPLLVLAQSAAS